MPLLGFGWFCGCPWSGCCVGFASSVISFLWGGPSGYASRLGFSNDFPVTSYYFAGLAAQLNNRIASVPIPEPVRLKIERAKKHLVDFGSETETFIKSCPYEIRPQRNPQNRRIEYILWGFSNPPPHLAIIAGDAIQNIRAALDYMAYLLFRRLSWIRSEALFLPYRRGCREVQIRSAQKDKGV